MSYTQADIDNIDAAIKEIAKSGVAEIEINGERTKYQNLKDLYDIRNKAQADLDTAVYDSTFIKVGFVDVD